METVVLGLLANRENGLQTNVVLAIIQLEKCVAYVIKNRYVKLVSSCASNSTSTLDLLYNMS